MKPQYAYHRLVKMRRAPPPPLPPPSPLNYPPIVAAFVLLAPPSPSVGSPSPTHTYIYVYVCKYILHIYAPTYFDIPFHASWKVVRVQK